MSQRFEDQDSRDDDRPRRRQREYDDFDDRPKGSNGAATTALVLGLMSFLCSVFTGIPAIIFGIIGLTRAKENGVGKGMAIAGISLGVFSGICMFPVMIGLLLPAVVSVRSAAARSHSTNNFKKVGLGLHEYHDNEFAFPRVNHQAKGEKEVPLLERQNRLSWRFSILPYIGENALFSQYAGSQKERWDSPANRPLAMTAVRTYMDPLEPQSMDTRIRVLEGPGTMFDPTLDRPVSLVDVPDGTSNTILAIEAADKVPWPQNKEIPFSPNAPFPQVGHPSRPAVLVLFADGSVRSVSKNSPALAGGATRNGGEGEFLGD